MAAVVVVHLAEQRVLETLPLGRKAVRVIVVWLLLRGVGSVTRCAIAHPILLAGCPSVAVVVPSIVPAFEAAPRRSVRPRGPPTGVNHFMPEASPGGAGTRCGDEVNGPPSWAAAGSVGPPRRWHASPRHL